MPISIACDACGYQFKVKDDFAGRKGKCPRCSDIFLAPGGKPRVAAKAAPKTRASKTRPPSAQPRKKVAASAKGASASKKRSVARGTAVGKPAPKAVKVKSVALPTGQAVASTPAASTPSTYRRRRRSAPPVWIWLILGGSGIAAIVGWVLFATDNLKPKDDQLAEKGKQQQTAGKEGEGGAAEKEKDREAAKKENDTDKANSKESDSSGKEKAADSDDEKKQDAETGVVDNKAPKPKAPEKPADPPVSPSVTAEQITTLANACREFQWQPKSKDNYAQMAQCALRMNQAMGEMGTDAAADVASEIFQELIALKWNANDIRAVNRFAAKQMGNVGAGAFLLVEVKSGKNGRALTQLIETGELVMIGYDKRQAEATPKATWLILGVNTPKETKISFTADGKVTQNVRNVEQMFLVKITIQTKAGQFGRDP